LEEEVWVLYVDGASNKKGSGAGIVLQGLGRFRVEEALMFKFKTSNNQVEYEALITRLLLARDMGATKLSCKTDSKLMVGYIIGEYQVKNHLLIQHYHKVKSIIQEFGMSEIEHIPREKNTKVDSLSNLASCKKQTHHNSIIQQTLHFPTVTANECLDVMEEEEDWMVPIKKFIMAQEKREIRDVSLAKKIAKYTFISQDLYR